MPTMTRLNVVLWSNRYSDFPSYMTIFDENSYPSLLAIIEIVACLVNDLLNAA